MKCLILSFFQLILKISFKHTLNIINKGLKTFKIFFKKDFKVESYYKNSVIMTSFILGPFKTDNIIKK